METLFAVFLGVKTKTAQASSLPEESSCWLYYPSGVQQAASVSSELQSISVDKILMMMPRFVFIGCFDRFKQNEKTQTIAHAEYRRAHSSQPPVNNDETAKVLCHDELSEPLHYQSMLEIM